MKFVYLMSSANQKYLSVDSEINLVFPNSSKAGLDEFQKKFIITMDQ
jgi:hypothetical protein